MYTEESKNVRGLLYNYYTNERNKKSPRLGVETGSSIWREDILSIDLNPENPQEM